jgi:hypothetical protein
MIKNIYLIYLINQIGFGIKLHYMLENLMRLFITV